ncbi:MAG: PQQ-binding-like beta-propeller repeat protein [Labilithrix sp.]|nr:PQQ-binding-like beta-propeller repeat protein [Labilithrix sp.]
MRRSSLFLPAGLLALGAVSLGACTSDGDGDDVESAEQSVATNVHVLTSRNDLNRTGANTREKLLTTGSVASPAFGKLFSRPVDGQVYAQPLYVGGVNGKNVVFVATEHNSVYAFDADDTRASAPPLWSRNFGPSVPSSDTQCGLLGPEVGITSTPVIDLQAKTIWFTSRNKENGKFFHKLHALDIATGEPRPNSPVVITAQAPGNGDASVNGVIKLDPLRTMQRPGLLKVGNRIFLGFASLCDIGPYHGWVLGYDATTLAQTHVHITTPNGGEGGIWNGGVGLNADASGDIYYTSADVYDTSGQAQFNGAGNLGNSIVRLHDNGSTFSVVTKFTPFDTRIFSPQDRSLGNGGGILIPGTRLFVAGDKRGVNFLVDRDDMGGQADQDAQIVQKWQGTARGMWGGGAYYRKGAGGLYYLWGIGDRLRAYKFNGQKFELPALVNTSTLTGYPGGALSISSDGERSGTAVLWAVRGKRTSAGLAASTGAGTLLAFDANDVTQQLYSSDDSPADVLGDATKFAPPTIAGGRVIVGTSSNQLVVYGLKNASAPDGGAPAVDGGASGADGSTSDGGVTGTDGASDASAAPTWTELYAQYFGPGTPGHCSGTGGCHTNLRGGFKCGTNKNDCFAGLVAAGLVDPQNPTQSSLAAPGESPLVWLGGSMPIDNPAPNPAAAAAVKAWVAAGAQNN